MSATMRHVATVAMLVLAVAGRAAAFDLTGTWQGSSTCTSLFAGEKFKFKDEATIQITQVGDAIGFRADYGGGDVDVYAGIAHPDAKKPDEKGELALVVCGTDSVAGNGANFDEVGRFSASTKVDKVKATVKGLSFFSDPGTASPEAGTCKWKLTRVDAVDAAVSTTCPPSGSTVRSAMSGAAPDRHRRRR